MLIGFTKIKKQCDVVRHESHICKEHVCLNFRNTLIRQFVSLKLVAGNQNIQVVFLSQNPLLPPLLTSLIKAEL